jgi:hypothetical protein
MAAGETSIVITGGMMIMMAMAVTAGGIGVFQPGDES